jgi:Kef-type K+ transport system membrane component KefB
MSPRGEVALIVALIGLQMNAISQRAYAIVVFMTALTTLIPPYFIKRLFRDDVSPLVGPEQEEEVAAEENMTGHVG